MNRRALKVADRIRGEGASAPGSKTAVAEARLQRAACLMDCTRAILRASGEVALADTLCPLLVYPGAYAEAGLTLFLPSAEGARHSSYAGPDEQCTEHPDRFWALSPRAAALHALVHGERCDVRSAADVLLLPLQAGADVIGALALTVAGGRRADAVEIAQLERLADDIGYAIGRLRAEAPQRSLALSERRLRETFDQAGVGITRIDMDGRFIEVNQKFCDMLGYTRDELVGRPTREFTVAQDFGAGPTFRAQAQRGHATLLTGEKRYVRKNGTPVWVRRTMSVARDEQGQVRDGISVVEDITERKVAEEAARNERALLRTIIDAVPLYIYVKDTEGNFTMVNRAWLDGLGLDFTDVLGKTARDLFPPEAAERMEMQDRTVLEGEPIVDAEHCTALSEGRAPRWSSTTKVPLRDGAGRVNGLVGISRDITARRRMERERAMEHVVARVLSESRSVEETMPRLISTVCEAMGWVYGAHWVWDASAAVLRRAGWWCEFEPRFDPADEVYWQEITRPTTTGLIGNTWIAQQPTWMTDIAEMPAFKRAPSCALFDFRSAFAFPIHAQDDAVGVIEFFGRDIREPDEALLQVSGAISRQIGQFIRRKQAEQSLQESELQLRAMFENADVGIAVTGLDMRYMRVNDKYCRILGYSREELLGMRTSEVNLESNVQQIHDDRERMLSGDVPNITIEKQLVRSDGSLVWVSLARSLVRSADSTPRHFVAVIQDISDNKRAAEALKESEEQFRVLAHYDILTGLPNRALFYDRLTQALAQARRNRWWLAVMFIDVDRFKNVNDTFGHAAGDQLLKQVSGRLAECVRTEDTVGRLSGDEFAIVLSRLVAPVDAGTVAKKIVQQFNRPFQLEGTEVFVTASIGITVFPTDTVDQDTLIRNADVAMYQAKDRGRNTYQFYTPEMNRRTREMLNMEGELRRALERDEFVLHYQPKVSLVTGRVTGAEALLRWRHPERGLVPPSDFIPLLEETGLVVHAGEWVLHAVCRQLTEWRSRGIDNVPIAVNLSARQFLAPDLGQSIKTVLEQHAIAPQLLEVEITESAIMSDTEEANRTLEYLDGLGVKSAIDDFGTGYSSLGYLKRFPLGALKVDRSFVSDITTDADDAHITQAVISMAHSLGLKVIAEGVETEAQLEFLLRYGCDEVQGYLFARPVSGDECAAAIADEQRFGAMIEAIAQAKS